MKSIIRYITSFFKGLFSLLTGMKVTLREFFTKKTLSLIHISEPTRPY